MKQKFTSLAFSALFLSAGLGFTSCSNDDDKPASPKPYQNGVFITNEGQFQKGNGAVSFIGRESRQAQADIFRSVNNRPLGDVVQSMTVYNGKAYVVVNNSEKIEVADANTFKEAGVINGLQLPRYAAAINNKLYVTEWVNFGVSGRVAVIDLATNTVSKTITVGQLPEKVLLLNNKLYVVNSGENTLSVINTATDAVENTMTIGDSPNSLVADANNNIWVLCGGNKVYDASWNLDLTASTAGSLVKLNATTHHIDATLPFTSKADIPSNLAINNPNTRLYFNAEGKLYSMETSATALPTAALISRNFNGLGIDPTDNTIYGAVSPSFSANGKVIRYNAGGTALDSFTVAIGPNNFLFQ